jgi:hypothetical protein
MQEKYDGDSAFPRAGNEWSEMEWVEAPAKQGMTLRDYFAAKAMQGMFASDTSDWNEEGNWEDRAQAAYAVADAMLEAREQQ